MPYLSWLLFLVAVGGALAFGGRRLRPRRPAPRGRPRPEADA